MSDFPSCALCGANDPSVARAVGCCVDCIRAEPERALPLVDAARRAAGPHHGGAPDVRRQSDGRLVAMGFYDDHPANCIAAWQCPGTTGSGHPEFAVAPRPERGCRNLAIFTAGCNFSCAFCQDWIHEDMRRTGRPAFTDDEILGWIDDRTTCVCFCGGTPDVQMGPVTRLAEAIRARHRDRVMRICAETNLTADWDHLEPFARIAYESGGGLNIGLKAGSPAVHRALTGVSNDRVWRNVENLYATFGRGDVVPFLRPSLLIVPGYVDEAEVRLVARRLATLDAEFSLILIGFLPRYLMTDLPGVAPGELRRLAMVAREEGLRRVSPDPASGETKSRFVR